MKPFVVPAEIVYPLKSNVAVLAPDILTAANVTPLVVLATTATVVAISYVELALISVITLLATVADAPRTLDEALMMAAMCVAMAVAAVPLAIIVEVVGAKPAIVNADTPENVLVTVDVAVAEAPTVIVPFTAPLVAG